jgi:hypothetical protein
LNPAAGPAFAGFFVYSYLIDFQGRETYIHRSDLQNSDAEPLCFGPLSESQVRERGNYTAAARNGKGEVSEAISFLRGEPNYYWTYLYDDRGRILQRIMAAFLPDGELPLSRLQIAYKDDGAYTAAYYTSNPVDPSWKLKYLKTFDGIQLTVTDYTPQKPDPALLAELKRVNAQLEELDRLESRGILKKIFGIR